MIGERSPASGTARPHGFAGAVRSALAIIALLAMNERPAVGAEGQSPARVRFTDVTKAAGIDFIETIGDDEMSNIIESAGVGCAFLDYDNDGWMDIYFVNGCWLAGISDPELDAKKRETLAGANWA